MATFSIEVLGDDSNRGQIVVGEFTEYFQLELTDWSARDYTLSWRRALEELVAGAPAVALMTWCARPARTMVRRAWTLHREGHAGHAVFVQERIFVPDDHTFDLDASGRVVNPGPRATVSEDGQPISSWTTDVHEIAEFLTRGVELPDGWFELQPTTAGQLEAELRRELCSGHPLFGLPVRAVARRGDRDDVLFRSASDDRVFVVHLTWSAETDPRWPATSEYASHQQFLFENADDADDHDAV